jgi:hypothetical protein
MTDVFDKIKAGMADTRDGIMGPGYEYWANIKPPNEMGMSENGSLGTLGNNISGLISYVQVLVSGNGEASRPGGPLGNKFFLKTAAKCKESTVAEYNKSKTEEVSNDDKNKKEEKLVDRYIYISNVPDGTIPFISSGMGGAGFSNLKGLIPGAMGNLTALSPFPLFQSFSIGNHPHCAQITMETVGTQNQRGTETHHVALADVENMNACWFLDKVNPVSGQRCRELFTKQTTIQNNVGYTNVQRDAVNAIEDGSSPWVGDNAGSSGLAYNNTRERSPLGNSNTIMAVGANYNPIMAEYSKYEEPSYNKNNKNNKNKNKNNKKIKHSRDKKPSLYDYGQNDYSSFYKVNLHGNGLLEHTQYDSSSSDSSDYSSDSDSDSASSVSSIPSGPFTGIETPVDELLYKMNKTIKKLSNMIDKTNTPILSESSEEDSDAMTKIYYASISLLLMYILYRTLFVKTKK